MHECSCLYLLLWLRGVLWCISYVEVKLHWFGSDVCPQRWSQTHWQRRLRLEYLTHCHYGTTSKGIPTAITVKYDTYLDDLTFLTKNDLKTCENQVLINIGGQPLKISSKHASYTINTLLLEIEVNLTYVKCAVVCHLSHHDNFTTFTFLFR